MASDSRKRLLLTRSLVQQPALACGVEEIVLESRSTALTVYEAHCGGRSKANGNGSTKPSTGETIGDVMDGILTAPKRAIALGSISSRHRMGILGLPGRDRRLKAPKEPLKRRIKALCKQLKIAQADLLLT